MNTTTESTMLFDELKLYDNQQLTTKLLEEGTSRYLRDLKVNLNNVLVSEYLSEKETALIALAIAANEKNDVLIKYFSKLAEKKDSSPAEIAEAIACASLLASNNVLYRFRHFINKEKYNELPARIKMNIMMKPVGGTAFFELMSLAVSAVNGCEMCVNAHEDSLKKLGSSEERIFDAIRLSAVVTSLGKIVRA